MSIFIDAQQKQRILQRGFGTVTESGGGSCWIKFEQSYREVASKSGGKPEYIDVILAHVHMPGGDKFTKEMNEAGENWLRGKHPRFVQNYELFKAGKEQKLEGTPISQFPALSLAKVKMLESRNIFTVEQLASLSDAQLGDLGMGAREMQKKAKSFLDFADKTDKEMKAVAENEKLKAKLQELETKLDVLTEEKAQKKKKKE